MSSHSTTNAAGAQALRAGGEGWSIVDVRTAEEFNRGHPAGAHHVPLAVPGPFGLMFNPGFVAAMKQRFAPSDRLILTCAVGSRSRQACEILAAEGFSNLVNLHGGFDGARDMFGRLVEPGWAASGLAVETGASTPVERADPG